MPQYANTPAFISSKPVATTALASSLVLKASPGNLLSLTVVANSVSGWAMLFDATAAPADGAVQPAYAWPVNAGGFVSFGWGSTPARFLVGIVVVFSTTGPFAKTASATSMMTGQVQ